MELPSVGGKKHRRFGYLVARCGGAWGGISVSWGKAKWVGAGMWGYGECMRTLYVSGVVFVSGQGQKKIPGGLLFFNAPVGQAGPHSTHDNGLENTVLEVLRRGRGILKPRNQRDDKCTQGRAGRPEKEKGQNGGDAGIISTRPRSGGWKPLLGGGGHPSTTFATTEKDNAEEVEGKVFLGLRKDHSWQEGQKRPF